MGQKVKPIGLRLGINRTWDSLWIAGKDYPELLKEDAEIRTFLLKKLKGAAIAKITIERPSKKCRVFIHTARPGVIIGKKGAEIENLRKEIQKKSKSEVVLNIVEVRKPDIDAKLIADSVADQLERRVAYRRAMKRAVQNAIGNGAKGVRIRLAGRLAGAEIARVDWYIEGSLPLHTLRADIDYGMGEAHTTYGVIGIQVWVNHGEKYGIDYSSNVQ
ncbi:MAG: 30S ribosomal protein S3 [Blastochloris viridis]|uniref:Small ribosomal subunit protein uS3 n=1 Tax=Blastochloris viridis TaxID=1079 RepID=A0A6N4RCQ0_BLAVI|nr:MAG: 30S ribosomal protein S3 [Blastochloris viridis]